MSLTCCDTSFLFALYSSDIHSEPALAEMKGIKSILTLSALNEFELENAIRCTVFRRLTNGDHASLMLTAFRSDLAHARFVLAPCNLASVLSEAGKLSAAHSMTGGHRAFDILHVAAALHLGARDFLSFDANQRKLAKAVGLKVRPARA